QYIGDPTLLHLWDGPKDQWQNILPGDRYLFCIDGAVFSSDSSLLVFASGTDGGGTKELERLNLGTGRRLTPIEFPGYSVRFLAFAPDESRVAAVTYGGVLLYKHQRKPVKASPTKLELEDEPGQPEFRPDAKELAILYWEDILFWDGRSAEAEMVSPGAGVILSLAWSPDSRSLVLGCKDGTVRVWDREAGKETRRFDWKIGEVSSVAFAPDGMTCGAGGEKGHIVIWDVED